MGVARWHVPGGGGVVGLRTPRGEGDWVKNPKLSRRGSVSGMPRGTGTGDVAWGWHSGAYEVMVVVGGLCARKTRGGGGGWAETRNQAIMAQFRAHRVERR